MRGDRSTGLARWLEWTLLAIGVACLVRYGWVTSQVKRLESDNHAAVTRMLDGREGARLPEALPDLPDVPGLPEPDPALIGELDIPRLHFSAPVMMGDDDGVLDGAVGFLPDTAYPWEQGNSVFAAHRDRLFRPLKEIRAGDDIWLSTRHGRFQYRVRRTLVVEPRDVWVLDSAPGVNLTLITCYPFVYVGHAPHRFVVRAQKILQDEDE